MTFIGNMFPYALTGVHSGNFWEIASRPKELMGRVKTQTQKKLGSRYTEGSGQLSLKQWQGMFSALEG